MAKTFLDKNHDMRINSAQTKFQIVAEIFHGGFFMPSHATADETASRTQPLLLHTGPRRLRPPAP